MLSEAVEFEHILFKTFEVILLVYFRLIWMFYIEPSSCDKSSLYEICKPSSIYLLLMSSIYFYVLLITESS